MNTDVIFIMVVFTVVGTGIYIFAVNGMTNADKRRKAMSNLAEKLGLYYYVGQDRGIIRKYSFVDKFHQGRDRYAYNMLYGNYRGCEVRIFDYHCIVGTGTMAVPYFMSFYLLELPSSLQDVKIMPEALSSKVGQAIGYDDIDFESYEFSRQFCVRARNKKFAYDICNAKMIDYLLSNTNLSIEIEKNILAIYFHWKLVPQNIEANLKCLFEIRSRIPDYVFNQTYK